MAIRKEELAFLHAWLLCVFGVAFLQRTAIAHSSQRLRDLSGTVQKVPLVAHYDEARAK